MHGLNSLAVGSTPPPLTQRERALRLHTRGLSDWNAGMFRLFEQATEVGLAQSAVALAGAYNPNELGKLNVVGRRTRPRDGSQMVREGAGTQDCRGRGIAADVSGIPLVDPQNPNSTFACS